MATRGASGRVCAGLVILGLWPGVVRGDSLVKLTGWADESVVVRGSGLGDDVYQIMAEVAWDAAAPRDRGRYAVRVAFPDGRVDTRSLPAEYPPGRKRCPIYVLAAPLRDQLPSAVKVAVSIVDASSGAPVSNVLTAGIEQFPRPRGDVSANDPGPFGWGKPLEATESILPSAGPDGLRFARIAGSPGLFVATTESSVSQVAARLKDYDPKAGRSDEFALEDPAQPAINLTPARALDYLKGLGQGDPSGVVYRPPTVAEWTAAAKGGKTSTFWWGDEPSFPEGANLLGGEPALAGDTTAIVLQKATLPPFKPNPFGLLHTFGNVAEWASDPSGGFARMGGHFRTEPASPLPEVKVEKPDELGPDPFVGVRAAFELTPESGAELIRKKLAEDPRLKGVAVAFDPDRALATLTGPVVNSSTRRAADQLLYGLWFLSGVEDRLEPLAMGPNQLVSLGAPIGPARRVGVLDRTFVEVPLAIRWLDPLPVTGTEWWANVYLPGGGHVSHKLDPGEPGRTSKLMVRIDRTKLASFGLPDTSPVKVALSIGGPAPTASENRVVSNVADVRPSFPARTR